MVRRDAAGKEVRGDEHALDRGGACLRRDGEEDCPDGKQLAELQGIAAPSEVELDLRDWELGSFQTTLWEGVGLTEMAAVSSFTIR